VYQFAGAAGVEKKQPLSSDGVDLLNDPMGIRISEVIRRYGDKLITNCPGTGGVALSLRFTAGEILSDQPCLTFFVDDKETAKHKIPREIDGVPTDIVEAGIPAVHSAIAHVPGLTVRPAEPGCSVSHFRVTSGTLGCLVKDDKGALYILSCAHVLSDKSGSPNDPIVQPGTSHGGAPPADCLAKLTRQIPLMSGDCLADAAIAEVIDCASVTPLIRYIGSKPRATRTLKGVGINVQKSGDETNHTVGVVIGLRGRVGPLTINGVPNIFFNNTIITSGMSKGGDSGAILLDFPQNAIGLLFGGQEFTSKTKETTVVASWYSPINGVLKALGVHLA
jgi:hypothetical protein